MKAYCRKGIRKKNKLMKISIKMLTKKKSKWKTTREKWVLTSDDVK